MDYKGAHCKSLWYSQNVDSMSTPPI